MEDFRLFLTRSRIGPILVFKPLETKKGSLSVQASRDHYSEPRESGLCQFEYSSWEVKLPEGVKPPGFKPAEHEGCPEMGAWVPTAEVQRLWEWLNT